MANGLRMAEIVKPELIITEIIKLPASDTYGVLFRGLTASEAETLVDTAIKLEQVRTGNVLTPTEYGDRFSGIDLG